MRIITIAELRQLRAEYHPESAESFAARINALTTRDAEWKARAISRNMRSRENNQRTIARFDAVLAYLATSPLVPDSHGGAVDKCDLWNGALFLVRENPDDYQIAVPQYGQGIVLINLAASVA